MKENNRIPVKNRGNLLGVILMVGMLSALPLQAYADNHKSWQEPEQGDWFMSSSITGAYGSYSGSSLRDKFYSAGITFGGEYLEQHGFSVGYTNSTVKFNSGVETIKQNEYFLSGHRNFNSDGVPGTIDIRLNGHYISNNDSTGDSDKVAVVAPLVSYLSYKKSLYADLGYAHSSYQNDLSVSQFSPTIGLGFSNSANWIQLRGYFISLSNAARAQGKSSTAAAQLKFTHWFSPDNALNLNTLGLTGMLGERIYAVDFDSQAVYNLADVQKGSVAVYLNWKFPGSTYLLFHAGYDRYENLTINEKYSSSAAVLSLSKEW
ncbi:MAG: hypothetical protein HQL71_04140 [Magnetococcales bacterium]|nr:hypothetical protein [Magnetococcales bacterium]